MDEPLPSEPQGPLGGFWSSIIGVLSLLVDIVSTRAELLLLDLQEGAERVLSMLLWSLIGLWAAAMTLLLGALTLIFAFWETHRVLVAGLITALFAALTLTAMTVLRHRMRSGQALFAATLGEFARDRQRLGNRQGPANAEQPGDVRHSHDGTDA